MSAWYTPDFVQITHLPTGHAARVEARSRGLLRPARKKAFKVLRAKVAAMPDGLTKPGNLIRTYDFISGDAVDELTGDVLGDVQYILDGNFTARK